MSTTQQALAKRVLSISILLGSILFIASLTTPSAKPYLRYLAAPLLALTILLSLYERRSKQKALTVPASSQDSPERS